MLYLNIHTHTYAYIHLYKHTYVLKYLPMQKILLGSKKLVEVVASGIRIVWLGTKWEGVLAWFFPQTDTRVKTLNTGNS